MEKIKVGCIGFGRRGPDMLKTVLSMCRDVTVAAVCDSYADRAENARKIVFDHTGVSPFTTTDAFEVTRMKGLDAVLIFSAWESHVPLAIDAMEQGKYAAFEVGGAYTPGDCFRLVETYERTGVPCMMLENCCYGRVELAVLNMVRSGMFGKIVHCSGGYHHDLRDEIAGGDKNRHYRLRNYLARNCENYPTHELGPIAKVMDINRGNRMVSLSSVASGSFGMEEYIKERPEEYPGLQGRHFDQGDVVNTTITCADGSTIALTLDTTLPRFYSREFTVRGTRAAYLGLCDGIFVDGADSEDFNTKRHWGSGAKYRREYIHPLWKKYGRRARLAGHDGMDFMVLSAFFEAVRKKTDTPIDAYDSAAWMSVTPLSEQSIKQGGAPVDIPDFTHGLWEKEREKLPLEFALD